MAACVNRRQSLDAGRPAGADESDPLPDEVRNLKAVSRLQAAIFPNQSRVGSLRRKTMALKL